MDSGVALNLGQTAKQRTWVSRTAASVGWSGESILTNLTKKNPPSIWQLS